MNSEQLEIIQDFISESQDILESLDPCLMRLETQIEESLEPDIETVHEVFRGFHSVKGAASYLKLASVTSLTHQAESLLDNLRKGVGKITETHLELFYRTADMLRSLLQRVESQLDDTGMEEEVRTLSEELKKNIPKAGAKDESDSLGNSLLKEVSASLDELLSVIAENILKADISDNSFFLDLKRDFLGVKSQLDVINYREMAMLISNLIELLGKFAEDQIPADLNVQGILHKLVLGIKQGVQAIAKGSNALECYGPIRDIILQLGKGATQDNTAADNQTFLGSTLVEMGVITQSNLEMALNRQGKPLGEILLEMELINRDQLDLGLQVQQEKRVTAATSENKKVAASIARNIRVDLNKLDLLGNLVGELVIAENMVTHHPLLVTDEYEELRKAAMYLDRITRDIQDLVMGLRMVPIQPTFQKMARVVRDVSHKLGKRVEVTTKGEDTEIDKDVVESLSSPLIHILRNSVDHGIETPDERRISSKSEQGHILLEAGQEGGEVRIRIHDDGAGINPEVILAKAREKGLVPETKTFRDDSEIFQLLFEPGFSTAQKVTDISGRGVGMDVVKKNIEALNGRVEIFSELGKGTTFALNIPLTLSIIEGIQVLVGTTVITIPMLNIRENISPRGYRVTRAIDGTESVMIRGSLVSIIRLYDFYNIPHACTDLDEGILIVVESGSTTRALMVDEIIGQRQTVIKRVSGFLGNLRGVSGFSILSDGAITLIMDVTRLLAEE